MTASRQQRLQTTLYNQGCGTEYTHELTAGIPEIDLNMLDMWTYLLAGNYMAAYILLSATEYQYRKSVFRACKLISIRSDPSVMQHSRGPLLQQGVTLPD